jgi:hypothetical protein
VEGPGTHAVTPRVPHDTPGIPDEPPWHGDMPALSGVGRVWAQRPHVRPGVAVCAHGVAGLGIPEPPRGACSRCRRATRTRAMRQHADGRCPALIKYPPGRRRRPDAVGAVDVFEIASDITAGGYQPTRMLLQRLPIRLERLVQRIELRILAIRLRLVLQLYFWACTPFVVIILCHALVPAPPRRPV